MILTLLSPKELYLRDTGPSVNSPWTMIKSFKQQLGHFKSVSIIKKNKSIPSQKLFIEIEKKGQLQDSKISLYTSR